MVSETAQHYIDEAAEEAPDDEAAEEAPDDEADDFDDEDDDEG
jgi:hypothetical protein